ncbi:MAG: hypothetical protein ACFE0Q_08545 [Anaerolineae bacterium]
MSKQERTIWDDIVDLAREVLEKLDEAFNPEKRNKPARVPVPVRTNYPPHQPDQHR